MPRPAQRRDEPDRVFDDAGRASEALPVANHRSYVGELGARFDELGAFGDEEASLTVPPGQLPTPWVASDIQGALTAMAETVPRSSSSPDAPGFMRSTVPAADLPTRAVRRPHRAGVDDFPVQLECETVDQLAAHRSTLVEPPAIADVGWHTTVDDGGSIASVVARLVRDERAVQTVVDPSANSTEAAVIESAASDVGVTSDERQTIAVGDVTLRAVVLLASALITGATLVVLVLRGLG